MIVQGNPIQLQNYTSDFSGMMQYLSEIAKNLFSSFKLKLTGGKKPKQKNPQPNRMEECNLTQ